jgi:hypothetical protein
MQQHLSRLLGRLDRLEAHRAAAATRLPAWAEEGTQGNLMVRVMLRDLGARVSRANNPDWFEPSEPTPEAVRQMGKLAVAMLATSSYADASMLAQAELAMWPRDRYSPARPTENSP